MGHVAPLRPPSVDLPLTPHPKDRSHTASRRGAIMTGMTRYEHDPAHLPTDASASRVGRYSLAHPNTKPRLGSGPQGVLVRAPARECYLTSWREVGKGSPNRMAAAIDRAVACQLSCVKGRMSHALSTTTGVDGWAAATDTHTQHNTSLGAPRCKPLTHSSSRNPICYLAT
uniref:Uncharacterized protein n=1 Tax=Setaria viridis TaxID=4556 RepID=A0A4U6TSA7_SETVI|nr:hypothetical protein SEVIR_8G111766v2 [Setaria viridis]